MNTNTRLFHFYSNSTFRVILIVAGIAIAALTFPTFGSNNQQETSTVSTNEVSLVTQTTLVSHEVKNAVNYHNFLASYFLQEASIDRSNLKPVNTSSPVMTLAKLPFSVAINIWTAINGN